MNIEELEQYKDLSVAELIGILEQSKLKEELEVEQVNQAFTEKVNEILTHKYYKEKTEITKGVFYHEVKIYDPFKQAFHGASVCINEQSIWAKSQGSYKYAPWFISILNKEDADFDVTAITKEEFDNAWNKVNNVINDLMQ